jgi:flagellar hook-basal body complex protein FliE
MGFIKGFFLCLIVGVLAALGLYVVAFVLELLNCLTCGISSACIGSGSSCGWDDAKTLNDAWNIGCDTNHIWELIPIWSGKIFTKVFYFCGGAGIVIGVVYGIVKQVEDNERTRNYYKHHEEELRKKEEERRKKEEEEYRNAEAAKNKADKEQRQKNAAEFKGTLPSAIERCRNNMEISETWELRPDYKTADLQKKIWDAVNEASLPLQRLDDIVRELKT